MNMTDAQRRRWRAGFTLVELLSVMGIMMVLAAIVTASYIGFQRGAGMRNATGNLRATLMLARQTAMTKGRKAFVIFDADGYIVCQKEGNRTANSGYARNILEDLYAEPPPVVGTNVLARVYNLDSGKWSFVMAATQDPQTGALQMRTQSNIWGVAYLGADAWGWEVSPKIYLPRGFQFGSGSPSLPEKVIFNGDGTTRNGDYVINVYEEISPTYIAKLTIKGLTGFVELDMP